MDYRVFNGNNLVNTVTANEQFIKQYCEKHGYTYEAIERVSDAETEPTAQDDTDAILIDHEYRLTLLELGLTEEV